MEWTSFKLWKNARGTACSKSTFKSFSWRCKILISRIIVYYFSLFGYLVTHHWTSCVEPKFNWIEWHAIIIVFGFSCQKSIVSWEWGMWSNIFFIKTGSPQPNIVRWSKGFCCNEKFGSLVFIFKHFSLYALIWCECNCNW